MNILLENFNAKVGRVDILKPTFLNDNLHLTLLIMVLK